MVKVTLWGSLRSATGGLEQVEASGTNTREVLDDLAKKYPALETVIAGGVSLAIDGTIYKDAWFTPISDSSEVVLMPYMAGG